MSESSQRRTAWLLAVSLDILALWIVASGLGRLPFDGPSGRLVHLGDLDITRKDRCPSHARRVMSPKCRGSRRHPAPRDPHLRRAPAREVELAGRRRVPHDRLVLATGSVLTLTPIRGLVRMDGRLQEAGDTSTSAPARRTCSYGDPGALRCQHGGSGGGAGTARAARRAWPTSPRSAGVSHQTVSRVLNGSPLVKEDTRARVLAAIEEMGYRRNNAARMLATNRSGRIGMISAHLALHGPSMIAVAVQEAGHDAGYDVSLVGVSDFSPESLQGAVDRLLDEAVEALVDRGRPPQRDRAGAVARPVRAGRARPGRQRRPAHGRRHRPGRGARLATEHLLDLGHRHVAHVTGPAGLGRGRSAPGRVAAGARATAACCPVRSSPGTGRRAAATRRVSGSRRTRT